MLHCISCNSVCVYQGEGVGGGQQDVLRLQVAVHHAVGVQEAQATQQLTHQVLSRRGAGGGETDG